MIWHLFGHNTSRPWDGDASSGRVAKMPMEGKASLTDDERRTFIEWIDMGALFDGIAGSDENGINVGKVGGENQ